MLTTALATQKKRVAVIGMGPSGIAATIAFIKESERSIKRTPLCKKDTDISSERDTKTDEFEEKENENKQQNIEYVNCVCLNFFSSF